MLTYTNKTGAKQMNPITKQQFIEKYGPVKVQFKSYYKYTFTFYGITADGRSISVTAGGDADEIYRMEVAADYAETVADLDPFKGSVYEDGLEVEGFYDY
jgi:hypothetical protein